MSATDLHRFLTPLRLISVYLWEGQSLGMILIPYLLAEAIALAKDSAFIAESLPGCVLDAFITGGEELLRLDRLDKTSLFQKQFERF